MKTPLPVREPGASLRPLPEIRQGPSPETLSSRTGSIPATSTQVWARPLPNQKKEITVSVTMPAIVPAIARGLIHDERFSSCRDTVIDANPGMSADLAARIVEEALKFVAACARNPGVGLAPSRIVDDGWHALILHTAMYAELCQELGGRFVHHFPGYDPTHYDPDILDRTRELIGDLGYATDPDLWGPPSDELLASVAAKCQHAPDCTIVITPKPKPKVH